MIFIGGNVEKISNTNLHHSAGKLIFDKWVIRFNPDFLNLGFNLLLSGHKTTRVQFKKIQQLSSRFIFKSLLFYPVVKKF